MVKKFKEVTDQEFWNFIKNYPNRLIEEPGECIDFNDYSLGLWPASIIGRFYNNTVPESSKFEILENYKEIREERTKKKKYIYE